MTDDEILADILRREGGFIKHPHDTGGCTNMGITLQTLKEWRGQPVTCDDIRRLTKEEACEIYRARYLRPFDGVDPELKPQVVDIAVNSGVLRARALLAQAQMAEPTVGEKLALQRLKFLKGIVKNRPSQNVFLSGWLRRAVEFI